MTRIPLALALLLATTAAHAESVATILRDVHLHGYPRPQVVLQRLCAADNRPGPNASIDDRARYWTAVETLERQQDAHGRADRALAVLDAMATRERCGPCGVAVHVARAQRAIATERFVDAKSELAAAEPLLANVDDALRMEFLLTRARLADLRTEMAHGITDAV
ncbi:hypothetical protein, partial [Cognatilysobacter terrigena]